MTDDARDFPRLKGPVAHTCFAFYFPGLALYFFYGVKNSSLEIENNNISIELTIPEVKKQNDISTTDQNLDPSTNDYKIAEQAASRCQNTETTDPDAIMETVPATWTKFDG